MSNDIALRCEGLTKRYRIKRAAGEGERRRREDFFALDDVSFEVRRGEVLGVVGRNGAGKSTLLKVLSRIVQPTSGWAEVGGRLAALLEVGTGFHPELTGRENVYLNGTIMGMTRREVEQQFDSIVDFAGVAFFLDTPIKRYSSGMYVRLAFAVAAHLRSEILVLDEVLAVGDAAFQRKCLSKVNELAHEEGRTVLLVSHNASVIRQTASAALRLERGRLSSFGDVDGVLRESATRDSPSRADLARADRVDTRWGYAARMLEVEIVDGGRIRLGEPIAYTLTVEVKMPVDMGVGGSIVALDDTPIASSFSPLEHYEPGVYVLDVTIPDSRLAPGRYAMNIVIGQSSFAVPDFHYDGVMHAVGFEVTDEDLTVDWRTDWWGNLALPSPEVVRR